MAELKTKPFCRRARGCMTIIDWGKDGSHGHCLEQATQHVIWDENTQALLCRAHAREAAESYLKSRPRQIHLRVPDCFMPGARWIPQEFTCRVPPEEDPLIAIDKELVGAGRGSHVGTDTGSSAQ